jgi:hypothetical protein
VAALAAVLFVAAAAFGQNDGDPQARWTRLIRQADVIVTAECVNERSGWDDMSGLIVTTLEVRPRRFYKGELARTLTVKTLGGRVGDDSMAASHGATLAGGEQVLLFLKQSEFGSYFVVVGGEAGKVDVGELPRDTGSAPTMGTLAELTRLLNRTATE